MKWIGQSPVSRCWSQLQSAFNGTEAYVTTDCGVQQELVVGIHYAFAFGGVGIFKHSTSIVKVLLERGQL
jgi:hypothetical protein